MTVEELFSLQTDINKLRSLYTQLARHENFNPYQGNVITDMPKGGSGKNFAEWYAFEKERLEAEIESYKEKIRQDREKIEAYIEAAPYPECAIIRYKVINNFGWREIGDLVGYSGKWTSKLFWEYVKSSKSSKTSIGDCDSIKVGFKA